VSSGGWRHAMRGKGRSRAANIRRCLRASPPRLPTGGMAGRRRLRLKRGKQPVIAYYR